MAALPAWPAWGLNEARILDVSCHGMRIVQTGLPPGVLFEAEAINAADGTVLEEKEARSNAAGRLDVRLTVDLEGVRRLHGEVAKADDHSAEYGETDVDLNRHCRVVGRRPAPAAEPTAAGRSGTPTPARETAAPAAPDRSDQGFPWGLTAGLVGVAAAAVAAVVVLGRRRRPTPGGDER